MGRVLVENDTDTKMTVKGATTERGCIFGQARTTFGEQSIAKTNLEQGSCLGWLFSEWKNVRGTAGCISLDDGGGNIIQLTLRVRRVGNNEASIKIHDHDPVKAEYKECSISQTVVASAAGFTITCAFQNKCDALFHFKIQSDPNQPNQPIPED